MIYTILLYATYAVILILLGLAFLYLFPIVEICGDSMYPTLKNGELYISRRVFDKRECKPGHIYVLVPPYDSDEQKYIVKRLISLEDSSYILRKYYFVGDNPDRSYDSRAYGYVPCTNVISEVIPKFCVKRAKEVESK